jgi:hypothetical protein
MELAREGGLHYPWSTQQRKSGSVLRVFRNSLKTIYIKHLQLIPGHVTTAILKERGDFATLREMG